MNTNNGNKLVLGLGHKLQNGKDAAASFIMQERGTQFKIARISFADALRKEIADAVEDLIAAGRATTPQAALSNLCHIWNVPFDANAVIYPVYPIGKQRALLQAVGQGRRDWDYDYWVKKWVPLVETADADVIITTDLRYFNEMEAIKRLGGVTVKVTRVGYIPDPIVAQHVSENALNDATFDHNIVVKDGDIDTLRMKALHVFDFIMHQRKYGW